ncbi:hypothetical protein V8E55_005666 [Tylopilus felleus]
MASRVVYKVFGYVSPLLTCRRRRMRSPPRTPHPDTRPRPPSPPSCVSAHRKVTHSEDKKAPPERLLFSSGGTRRRRKERETMEKLRQVDVKAEHFLRQVQRAEQ